MTLNYRELDETDLEFISVAATDEISNGEKLFLEIDDLEIILFNIAGKFFAISNLCSHDGADLGEGEIEGEQAICPRHGARFDVATGKALTLPAVEDISAYPVRVEGNELMLGIPKSN